MLSMPYCAFWASTDHLASLVVIRGIYDLDVLPALKDGDSLERRATSRTED
jgi:hypothetical protein